SNTRRNEVERCFHKKKWTNNSKRGAQIIKYSQSPRTPIQGVTKWSVVSIKKVDEQLKKGSINY
ncbi:TPA: hypothetical protein ACSZGO_13625, partial [Listeria monocytogenes]|uniref:hypothetical protein n=2 Tax=Listeria monocytogenes TaxID=1639 RepID=UPI002B0007D1